MAKCVKVHDNNHVPKLLIKLDKLSKNKVAIGIPKDSSSFVHMLATVHEYGCDIKVTPKMRAWFAFNYGIHLKTNVIKIPERSFIRKTFDDQEDFIEVQGSKVAEQIILQGLGIKQGLGALGAVMASIVRAKLLRGDDSWPPLVEFTVRRRDETTRAKTGAANRKKKRKSETPLNNTGQNIRANIRWWIE